MIPFPFDELVETLKEYLKDDIPVVTRLARGEKGNPFLILIGTLLSLRTKDETTEKALERLTTRVETPQDMLNLTQEELQKIIYPVGFYRNKASTILNVSKILIEQYNGAVPDTVEELLKIKGIGRKTANLVVNEAYGKEAICVDTHVHKVSNRLGAVHTKNPVQTEMSLMKILPKKYWIVYNTLLVSFGKMICTPLSPRCSICPVSRLCSKRGVFRHR